MSLLASFTPRLSQTLRSAPAARAFATTPAARAAAAYGSGPAETTSSSGTADSGAGGGKQASSSSSEGKEQSEPNAPRDESAGDQSKPHYRCDPDTKAGDETATLKKPEDK